MRTNKNQQEQLTPPHTIKQKKKHNHLFNLVKPYPILRTNKNQQEQPTPPHTNRKKTQSPF
jgi:hypothetical protein